MLAGGRRCWPSGLHGPGVAGVSAPTDAVDDRVWVAVGLLLLSLLLATVGTVAYIVGESAQKGPTSSDDAS